MGVKGLSTFIARNANEYFKAYQLHDTYLLIDGLCLACHLYKWHSKCNDCFGGDYDKYAHTVYKFFHILQECNVIPIVIFDGGYEDRKLNTVCDRMRERVRLGKNLNAVTEGGLNMFPLFVRELFKDIVLRLNVKAVKCDFEGDYEIACVAKTLGCPAMSYDSDFYLFDVEYIPFSTVELQVCTNKEKVKYIPCKIYSIEKFLNSFGGLSKNNLPLLGVLLGNDYIKQSTFSKFYEHIKLAKRKGVRSDQQRKIFAIIHWLKHETFESAVTKILGRLKATNRKSVARRIKQIAKGYVCTESEIIDYLGIPKISDNSEMQEITTFVEKMNELTITDEEDDIDQKMDDEEKEEEDEISDDNDEEETQWGNITVPDWFFHNFRQCKYPSSFMDILFRNTYYFSPQVENYDLPSSQEISLEIVAAIHGILRPNCEEGLWYYSRHGQNDIKRYNLPSNRNNLPSLSELHTMGISTKKELLFKILKVDSSFSSVLDVLPSVWHLYIIGIKFWFEKAKPQILNYHLHALLLCGIVIQYCDKQVGFFRSTKKFLNKYESKIKSLENTTKNQSDSVTKNYWDEITFNDALRCLHVLIDYFQLDYRMRASMKLFDISIIHSFAQFQSCLLQINHLNALLDFPFENTVISDFYDGTFVYNACINFSKRSCVEMYVKTLLKDCPSVLNNLLFIVNKLDSVLNINSHVASVIKRRKKRKNKKKNVEQSNESDGRQDDSSGTEHVDENNRFSILLSKKCAA